MRKFLLVLFVVLLCAWYAAAQDYPKAEVFGGFSTVHIDTEGATSAKLASLTGISGSSIKTWYPGWEAAAQFNFRRMLGVKADFSGHYGTPLTIPGVSGIPKAKFYNFLFGPVFSFHTGRMTPFAHALFGGNHLSIDSSTISVPLLGSAAQPGFSETAFAMAFGGGLDVKLTHHFGVRVGQFDYLYTKHCLNLPADFAGLGNPAGCLLGSNSIVGSGAPAAHQNNFRISTGIVIQ